MANRGFLIRFIDIGLIVLFGFVMISDIDNASQVALGTPADSTPERDRDSVVVVTVTIEADGAFALGGPVVGDRGLRVTQVAALESTLRALRPEGGTPGRQLVVLIRPSEASVVQRTVDVMDVCDRLGIAKSLQMLMGPEDEA